MKGKPKQIEPLLHAWLRDAKANRVENPVHTFIMRTQMADELRKRMEEAVEPERFVPNKPSYVIPSHMTGRRLERLKGRTSLDLIFPIMR